MSESQYFKKEWLHKKELKENAVKRGSNYVSDYEKEERIALLEWEKSRHEEKDDFDKGNRLFDYTNY